MAILYSEGGMLINGIEPDNGTDFTLEEMYEWVNTDIVEFVTLNDGQMMIIDEEGKLKGRKINEHATRLYFERYGMRDFICGDALVCDESQVR